MNTDYEQRIRFSLAQLRRRNGHFTFEALCLDLARVTVTPNLVVATGPISGGGDQGRDFETYRSYTAEPTTNPGQALELSATDQVAFVCTIQQRGLTAKILADVAKVATSDRPFDLVIAYCEADLAVSQRHRLAERAAKEHDLRLEIFDGTFIAAELARRPELAWLVERDLFVTASDPEPEVRTLPRAPMRFINRGSELSELDGLLRRAEHADGPTVGVVTGMRGVGKSAISNVWAHRHRDHFEGDLFADFSRRRHGQHVDPSDVLGDLLRDLGTPPAAVPATLSDRQRLFQRVTAQRRLLVVLDDIDEPAQALAALPSGPGSVVVVTSSRHLDELVYEGADLVSLGPLQTSGAHLLLAEMVGAARLSNEEEATGQLLELCGGLPIALCVAAGRLVRHPEWAVDDLLAKIDHEQDRLAALSGEGRFDLTALFDFAYADLEAPAAELYRCLALLPGPTITGPLVAVALDRDLDVASTSLRSLEDANLATGTAPDRYRLHDLVREHSERVGMRDLAEAERLAAQHRAVRWWRDAARVADHAVVADRLRFGDEPISSAHLPVLTSPEDSFTWFASERPSVLAAMRLAADLGLDRDVWHFGEALWPLVMNHKFFPEWLESQSLAAASANRVAEHAWEARVRSQLAQAYAELGREQECLAELDRSLRAVALSGDAALWASVIEYHGVCDVRLGRVVESLRHFGEARDRFLDCGLARGVAIQDYHLGWASTLLGDHNEALVHLDNAEPALREADDRITLARCWLRRGESLAALGRDREATIALEACSNAMAELGILFEQAEACEVLAELADRTNEPTFAHKQRQRAFDIYSELHHPRAATLVEQLAEAV